MFYDDLHLIRTFSPAEIRHAFTNNWDPDGLETAGYRPGSILFYHSRFLLFGENVVAQRLLNILLFAAFLSALATLAGQFGMQYWQVALAGLLTLVSRNNWYSLIWLADGVRPFVGLLLVLATLLLIYSLESSSISAWVVSLLLGILALATREEAIVVFPILLVLALFFVITHAKLPLQRWREIGTWRSLWQEPANARRLRFWAATALIFFATSICYLALRQTLVPQASIPHSLQGWQNLILWVSNPRGQVTGTVTTAWYLVLGFLIGVSLFLSPFQVAIKTLFGLVAFFMLCAFGLFEARINLAFLPIAVFSFTVVWMLGNLLRRTQLGFAAAMSFLALVMIMSASDHRIAQQALDPDSLQYLYFSGEIVLGDRGRVTIPASRLAALEPLFAKNGIKSWEDLTAKYDSLVQAAKTANHFAANADGVSFYPRIEFLQP